MNVLITGGSGFLGRALSKTLKIKGIQNQDVTVFWVSRSPSSTQQHNQNNKYDADKVMSYADFANTKQYFDVIINLAGAGIADKRWTAKRKAQLIDSRLKPTQAVIDHIQRISLKPTLFISGSAIGYYGAYDSNEPNPILDEQSDIRNDFAHRLCNKWETLALSVQNFMPVAIVRTGVVIAAKGGMIERLKLPFSLGLGGQLGDGRQMMSWISVDDWVRAVIFIIEQNLTQQSANQQFYNLTNPNPISNRAFTDALGQWLHRPTVMHLPAFLVKMMFGEMATLLLDGQHVCPKALMDKGFEFKDKTVLDALKDVH